MLFIYFFIPFFSFSAIGAWSGLPLIVDGLRNFCVCGRKIFLLCSLINSFVYIFVSMVQLINLLLESFWSSEINIHGAMTRTTDSSCSSLHAILLLLFFSILSRLYMHFTSNILVLSLLCS